MKLREAEAIAGEILLWLRPACEQIEIAGSIRRKKPSPKDIEFVFIPKSAQRPWSLFGDLETYSITDECLETLICEKKLARDTNTPRWGPLYKRATHVASGAVVEMFAATPRNWGLILALRTGPAGFNLRLVTSSAMGGATPVQIHMRNGYLWHQGQAISTWTETEFFETLEVPCWPPEQRTEARLKAWLDNPTLAKGGSNE